ncbi:MAG TPA: UPF0182 family protein [Acidimicrobiales bacterium]|nr:UPF0182 family protein [Acidimicrobiales bacterium]
MRRPTDVRPPSPRRRPAANRAWLVAAVAVLFLLVTSGRGIARFYTDYLWFTELGIGDVFQTALSTRFVLSAVFIGLFFVILVVNIVVADRLAPPFRPVGPEDEIVARYQEAVGQHANKVRLGVAALFALIVGVGAGGQWRNWLLFRNSVDFGVDDPVFDRDVSFYVFRLPFLSYLVDWLFVALVLVLVLTAVAHYLNGGIRLQSPLQRVTPQVKAHLSVLLGLVFLAKAAGYYVQRFELNFSTRGFVDGAGYTDVKAQLPAYTLLMWIMVAAFLLFIVNIWRRGWALPVIALVVWGIVALAAGVAYPAFIQKFTVEPNEPSREREYIARNIEATRAAMGLTEVQERDFDPSTDLDAADLAENAETIRNVRLWDPPFLRRTYQRLQEVRSFFRFNDVDVDRYEIDGQVTQVVLSARELNPDGLPSERKSWVNRHLQYTHGYGAVLSPANAVTADGQPAFLVQNVPPQGEPEITRPEIYFGEALGSYAIANTRQEEIDFTRSDGTDQTSSYEGKGGVPIDNALVRFALFARFGEVNILTSDAITSQSRALYYRDVRERARMAAPFLEFDSDPYPVVIDGRIVWVLDAYTTTDRYPYAQRADTSHVPGGSDLAGGRFNYIRNSVKVTVDAYEGDLTFHVIDQSDPIVRSWAKAFPDLFETRAVPDELREHFRYPEDMFRVQASMYGAYHIDDPLDFFRSADKWDISQDPGTKVALPASGGATATSSPLAVPAIPREQRMDPYYLLMRLPEEEQESFLLLQPFVPTSRDDQRKELTAFMVAKSDPDNYGELEAFVMPRNNQPEGPALVDARINQEPEISEQITLLSRAGSEVLLGNLLIVPVQDSLLYIRPLYVQAERTKVPQFKKAIVVYGDQVVMRDTLKQALEVIFGAAPETLEEAPAGGGGAEGEPEEPDVAPSVQALLDQAEAAFRAADEALRNGQLGTFETKYREAQALVARAAEALDESTPDEPASTTSTTAPPPSA